jgi:cystathionine beta-lyase/cystathionine gamma-synthase
MIYIETPSNPIFNVYSLKIASAIAKNHGLISVSDNTFLTPYLQNPSLHGIDLIIHSSTKFINGHSDVIGGAVCVSDDILSDKLKFLQRSIGAVPSPFDAWLILRSLKTLAVRMEFHNRSAEKIAEALKNQSFIKTIYYPGHRSELDKTIQESQAKGKGGVISFLIDENISLKEASKKLKIVKVAESLGGVETIMSQPYNMSHAVIPPSEKKELGITPNLLRLSVGLEDTEDVINDLVNAFSKA